jgi:hypothetical protein
VADKVTGPKVARRRTVDEPKIVASDDDLTARFMQARKMLREMSDDQKLEYFKSNKWKTHAADCSGHTCPQAPRNLSR